MPIGRIGDDFIVDTTTAGDQSSPTITALVDGRFVVTWYSFDNGTDGDIRARIYNANGSPVGDDFLVNSTTTGFQYNPAMTALAGGRFVVTWESNDSGDGSGTNIHARIYNANGSPAGDDFIVDTTTAGDQQHPTITALADGRFVATWQSFDNGTDWNIRARIYNANGSPAGGDFIVDTTTASSQELPTITTLADGRFVVTWESLDNGNDFDIRARVYNADGSPAGGDFMVNTTTAGYQELPTIMALADGRFVAIWESDDNGNDFDIRARVYNADGSPAGNDFVVNSTTTNDQYYPTITALADGRFAVAWESDDNGNDFDIRARVYNADGSPAGNDFVVNSTTTNDQYHPTITALADGRFVVTWQSADGGDGSGANIRSRIFDPTVFNGTAAGETWRGGDFGDVISGGAGDDYLYGLGGNDLIGGDAGNDTIQGGDGNDRLSGGVGNDRLSGGAGANTLDGGSGRDTASFDFASDQASITHLASGDWQVGSSGSVDMLSNIEVLQFKDGARVLRQAPASDFDASNVSDILWRSTGGMLMIWEMNNGTYSGFTALDGATGVWSVAGVGDFNNDGTADILWRSAGTVTVWTIGEGTHTGSTTLGGAGGTWGISGVGDFNGDGTSDVLWRDASGTMATWEMSNGAHTGSTVITSPGGTWSISGVGDFNGDGTSDVLWRNASGTVATWEMGDGLRTGATSITSPGGTWSVAGVGDFNGDGTSDILWRNASGTLATWEMGDGQRTGTTSIANPGGTWSIAGVGDYNGDGTSDILWRNANGTVVVWQMQNGRMFASTGIAGPGSNWQVA